MEGVGLAAWRFKPVPHGGKPAHRFECNFEFVPYAGGEVRSFVPGRNPLRVRLPIAIKARLYLHRKYQTRVSGRMMYKGHTYDPDLGVVISRLTQNLVSSSRSCDNTAALRENWIGLNRKHTTTFASDRVFYVHDIAKGQGDAMRGGAH